MLRPIISFCVARSLRLQDLIESAKFVFIEVAKQHLEERGQEANISRISVLTGVHRKDVVTISREGVPFGAPQESLTSRVIGQWRRDKRFLDKASRPRILSFEAEDSEFNRLVRLVSTDVHPGAVLFDLERLQAVERTSSGIRLKSRAYVPKHDPREGFRMMSRDVDDLMNAVMDNVFSESKELPNYHASAVFDNISENDLPKIRKWLFAAASAFHQRAARFLSRYDLDVSPNPKKKGGKRVTLGIFTRT
ncbi:MAG: hypothetical protein DCC75_09490 [Proteobacteria bacterium]|nr:MAG: hypothetical protein DCC75_09490 [Pseudomonadota bacterium]